MSLSMQHIGGLSGAMRVSGNYQTDFQQDEAKAMKIQLNEAPLRIKLQVAVDIPWLFES